MKIMLDKRIFKFGLMQCAMRMLAFRLDVTSTESTLAFESKKKLKGFNINQAQRKSLCTNKQKNSLHPLTSHIKVESCHVPFYSFSPYICQTNLAWCRKTYQMENVMLRRYIYIYDKNSVMDFLVFCEKKRARRKT